MITTRPATLGWWWAGSIAALLLAGPAVCEGRNASRVDPRCANSTASPDADPGASACTDGCCAPEEPRPGAIRPVGAAGAARTPAPSGDHRRPATGCWRLLARPPTARDPTTLFVMSFGTPTP